MNHQHSRERLKAIQLKARRIFADDAVDEETLDRVISDAWADGFQAGEQWKDL